MKRTILIIAQLWLYIFLCCLQGFAQQPKIREDKLILDEINTSKLKLLNPQILPDTFLSKKGFKLYKENDFKTNISSGVDKLKRFTLKEIHSRETNGGKLPLQSPLFFQKNMGQAHNSFKFMLQNVGSAVGFSDKGFTTVVQKGQLDAEKEGGSSQIKGHKIVLNFVRASGTLDSKKSIDGKVRFCKGINKQTWRDDIPSYNYLLNERLYPGISLVYQAKLGRLEYQLFLKPSARIGDIRISIKGVNKLSIDKNGNLVMHTDGGNIIQTAPKFYDISGKTKIERKGSFKIFNKKEYGFTVANHQNDLQLVIDPEIVFTSYFGGSDNDAMLGGDDGADDFIGRGYDIKIGANENIYIVGKTFSADFPVTDGSTINGTGDAFVMRIDPSLPVGSNIVYVTFLGGSGDENARSIEAMADGSAYVTGWSASADFPTSPGTVQPTRARSGAYIAKLSPNGEFEIGTFIGNARSNHPNSIVFNKAAIESEGFIYVGGSARNGSGSDATAESFQTTHGGGDFDGFITRLNLNLSSYNYFTYLGGAGRDVIMDIDVVDGFAFATGMTASKNFPVNDVAFQQQHTEQNSADCNGSLSNKTCAEAFVTRLNRNGNALIYSTFIGEPGREDYARGIAVNSRKQAYITGASASTTDNSTNIFVAKMEAGGENILWKTNIPATGRDHGEELVVDGFDRAHVTGTISVDGRATGLGSNTFNGGRSDMFYARIGDDGNTEFFTYLGGSAQDRGFSIATAGNSLDNFCVTLVGSTVSDDIETINPLNGGDERKGNADMLIYTICNVTIQPNASNFTKTAPQFVQRGRNIDYTIIFNNDGDTPFPVVITDNVPGSITVTGVSGTGCTRTGNSIGCSFVAEPGANPIIVRGSVNPSNNRDTCTSINVTNTATIQIGGGQFSASATTLITCEPPLCGNGRLDPGEQCDGSPNCRSNCTVSRCGDGILDPGEECDNNGSDCVGCRKILNKGDQCDGRITGSCPAGTTCKTVCTVLDCEDYWWDPLSIFDTPGCGEVICKTFKECVRNCGNGVLDPGEQCDGSANCRSDCTASVCGNGILEPGEECDDNSGNCTGCKRVILNVGDQCGGSIIGSCPAGTTCKTKCTVIECEHGIWDLWGLLADANCGDLLCKTYTECVPN